MAILYEKRERVAVITISRPEAMNAIDPETHWELDAAFRKFRDDRELWVAVLTGAGEKAFSAGADLVKLIPGAFAEARGRPDQEPGLGGLTRGLEIWKPVIAAINGHCLAGGLELALACDLRLAASHATFGLTETRWGLMPGAGGTQRLPRAISLAKAMELILLAETIDAEEAYRLGLVNKVVPLPELMPTALQWAQTLCGRGPLAVRAAKEAVLRGLDMPLEEGLRLEAFLSGSLRGTEDAQEGPRAFKEKRRPVFKGR